MSKHKSYKNIISLTSLNFPHMRKLWIKMFI